MVSPMTLYYDNIRVVLGLFEQNSSMFDLTPQTLVEGIGYDDKKSYDLDRQYSQPWNGYGKYEERNP